MSYGFDRHIDWDRYYDPPEEDYEPEEDEDELAGGDYQQDIRDGN